MTALKLVTQTLGCYKSWFLLTGSHCPACLRLVGFDCTVDIANGRDCTFCYFALKSVDIFIVVGIPVAG